MKTVYVMVNKENGATIECTKKYVLDWISRGFEVKEIKIKEDTYIKESD